MLGSLVARQCPETQQQFRIIESMIAAPIPTYKQRTRSQSTVRSCENHGRPAWLRLDHRLSDALIADSAGGLWAKAESSRKPETATSHTPPSTLVRFRFRFRLGPLPDCTVVPVPFPGSDPAKRWHARSRPSSLGRAIPSPSHLVRSLVDSFILPSAHCAVGQIAVEAIHQLTLYSYSNRYPELPRIFFFFS